VAAPPLAAPAAPAALRVRAIAALGLTLMLLTMAMTAAMTGAVTFTVPLAGAVAAAGSVATSVTVPAGMRSSARFTRVRVHVDAAGCVGSGVSAVRLFAPPLAVMGRPGGVVMTPVSQGF
jgi:hypothetical protein